MMKQIQAHMHMHTHTYIHTRAHVHTHHTPLRGQPLSQCGLHSLSWREPSGRSQQCDVIKEYLRLPCKCLEGEMGRPTQAQLPWLISGSAMPRQLATLTTQTSHTIHSTIRAGEAIVCVSSLLQQQACPPLLFLPFLSSSEWLMVHIQLRCPS